ncbi:hypothetical protein C8Q76DRAFT_440312 [Earliella scabrosa]|nr:hypothetical protein C8Q76DRAFT_440312 [Earliella scabrosa]
MAETPRQLPPSKPKKPQFRFRTKPVQERSIFESWAVLPAKTRLRVSIAITAFAGIGILVSDQLEKIFPPPSDAATTCKSTPTTNA